MAVKESLTTQYVAMKMVIQIISVHAMQAVPTSQWKRKMGQKPQFSITVHVSLAIVFLLQALFKVEIKVFGS